MGFYILIGYKQKINSFSNSRKITFTLMKIQKLFKEDMVHLEILS